MHACVYVCAMSCPTLWDPMDYVVAIFYSRGSSWPRNRTLLSCVSCIAGRLFTTEPPVTSLFHLFSSVQFSLWVMSNSLRSHEPQHSKPPCPSPTPEVHPNPCPLSRWCHPTISSSVVPFSSYPQSFPAWGSLPMSQLFASGGQSTGALALGSVLPKNIQDWFPLDWLVWSPCRPRDSQESSPTPQFKSINSLALSFLYSPTLTSIHDHWKTLTRWTFVGKVMSLLFNTLSRFVITFLLRSKCLLKILGS